ncbi:hypothetical protein JCM10449v2_002905 [Rhodotorula kratochvilovae]
MWPEPIPAGTFKPNERARTALANPLREGALLRPIGPCVDLKVVTPIDSSSDPKYRSVNPVETLPNPLRAPNVDLLDAVQLRQAWRDVAFHLERGLQVGHPHYAQVWSTVVEVDGRRCGKAVVKLFAEALWPLPHDFLRRWRTVEQRVESELQAYASLRPAQGRDVPHCYGAFPFEMPWGDIVTGVVLEDLNAGADPLERFCEREKDNLKTVEAVHGLMSPSFHHLHRLQALDVGAIQPDASDIFVLRKSTANSARFVFVGFSYAESGERRRRAAAAIHPEDAYEWTDEDRLEASWGEIIRPKVYMQWADYACEHEPLVWTRRHLPRGEWEALQKDVGLDGPE